MQTASTVANPFALLTDPESIFAAVEAAQRRDALNRRVCRPLDRLPRSEGQDGESHDAIAHDPPTGHVTARWSAAT